MVTQTLTLVKTCLLVEYSNGREIVAQALLAFTDQAAAAVWAHAGGADGACGNVAAVFWVIDLRFSGHGESEVAG
jgi:hypothetical protein